MLLALFLFMTGEVVARANAAKNLVLGVSNGIAAVGLAIFGDVRWPYAAPLALGLLIGGRLGPVVVRRLPDGPLRIGIALAGIGLALKLGSTPTPDRGLRPGPRAGAPAPTASRRRTG